MGWVDPWVGLGLVGLGRDLSAPVRISRIDGPSIYARPGRVRGNCLDQRALEHPHQWNVQTLKP